MMAVMNVTMMIISCSHSQKRGSERIRVCRASVCLYVSSCAGSCVCVCARARVCSRGSERILVCRASVCLYVSSFVGSCVCVCVRARARLCVCVCVRVGA